MIRALLICFSTFLIPCFALTTLAVQEGYIYEMYDPDEEIPACVLDEARSMYYEAYFHPKLHGGIPLRAMQIDPSQFLSYDEFIFDMFQRDFESYRIPGQTPRLYLQVRTIRDGKIIGVCSVLANDENNYYIDHIGVHKDFRRRKIATRLIKELLKLIPDFHEISLDTRVFNTPGQLFYENLSFKKSVVHPHPHKQGTYCHYSLKKPR